jgi:hypothetical protein
MLRTETEITKFAEKEPDYVKVYYKTVLAFKEIKNIPMDFLLQLCNYIGYADNGKQMTIILNKMVKDQISENLGLCASMVDKNIKKCVDAGILFKTKYRGSFIVNPFMIARGEWKNIKTLRADFDFISGKFSYKKELDEDAPQAPQTGTEG